MYNLYKIFLSHLFSIIMKYNKNINISKEYKNMSLRIDSIECKTRYIDYYNKKKECIKVIILYIIQ
jgi:hypothetical protein